jgi:hypothetical protein
MDVAPMNGAMKLRFSGTASLTVLAVLLTALVSCSEPRSEHPQQSHPKTRFLAEANAVCAEVNQRISALGQPTGSIREQAAMAREVNELTRSAIDRVQALPAPEGDAVLLDDIFQRARTALKLADRSTYAIERGKVAVANRAAAKAFRMLVQVNGDLAQYGLAECAK